jgi:hypothetical protein
VCASEHYLKFGGGHLLAVGRCDEGGIPEVLGIRKPLENGPCGVFEVHWLLGRPDKKCTFVRGLIVSRLVLLHIVQESLEVVIDGVIHLSVGGGRW